MFSFVAFLDNVFNKDYKTYQASPNTIQLGDVLNADVRFNVRFKLCSVTACLMVGSRLVSTLCASLALGASSSLGADFCLTVLIEDGAAHSKEKQKDKISNILNLLPRLDFLHSI
ncbi:MAG: hypothetical protein AAGA73_00765 [Pseudomonadota bacterium]